MKATVFGALRRSAKCVRAMRRLLPRLREGVARLEARVQPPPAFDEHVSAARRDGDSDDRGACAAAVGGRRCP